MTRPKHRSAPLLALLIAVLGPLGACGDDDGTGPPPPPPTGSVEVTTATAGESIDADGYVVAVDGGAGQAIGTDATLTVDDVNVGSRSVELGDVAANCTVSGDNPRTVSVPDGGVAATVFAVTCTGVGSVEITASTTGGAQDADGYLVSVGGGAEQSIDVNAILTVDEVPAGSQSVVLAGVAGNCTVAGENPRDVTVAADETVSTEFDVTCIAPIEDQIVFATDRDGNSEIYVMGEDGSDTVNLSDHAEFDGSPTVSPDGNRIAFRTSRDGDQEIYAMNADGSDQINLTANPADDQDPAWSPDGSQIAFASLRSGTWQIWVMDADGSSPTQLTDTNGTSPINQEPAWSPDGSQIAFTSNQGGSLQIWVMDTDGSNQTILTNPPGGGSFFPAWSPDGSQIAFATNRDGNVEVYVMGADGSGQTKLTNNPAYEAFPAWSPDGSRILFMTNRDGNDEIYVMNADGTGKVNVSNSPASEEVPGRPTAWR